MVRIIASVLLLIAAIGPAAAEEMAIGRYQVVARGGENPILVDTATGRTWSIGSTAKGWIPLSFGTTADGQSILLPNCSNKPAAEMTDDELLRCQGVK